MSLRRAAGGFDDVFGVAQCRLGLAGEAAFTFHHPVERYGILAREQQPIANPHRLRERTGRQAHLRTGDYLLLAAVGDGHGAQQDVFAEAADVDAGVGRVSIVGENALVNFLARLAVAGTVLGCRA